MLFGLTVSAQTFMQITGDRLTKTTLVEGTLPLNLLEPAAHPSGNIYNAEHPYTLPLNRRVALARCHGPYTEIDRKLWATLVAHAWDDLARKERA